jgi:inward rectifier potassium channel
MNPTDPSDGKYSERERDPISAGNKASRRGRAGNPRTALVPVRRGEVSATRIGLKRPFWLDLYHKLVAGSWLRLLAGVSAVFIGVGFLFALAFRLTPGAIEHGRLGSFADSFNFSIQTLSTLGYGNLAPGKTAAHILVTTEMLLSLSLLLAAVATGLVFAKFARPTAKLLFSEIALVTQEGGKQSLTLRIANQRANRIVDAEVRMTYTCNVSAANGTTRRVLTDLPLRRVVAPVLSYTWSAFHDIDGESPLAKGSEETVIREDGALLVSVKGTDDDLAATVHAQHVYGPGILVWNARFVDVLELDDEGHTVVRYDRFHDFDHETP